MQDPLGADLGSGVLYLPLVEADLIADSAQRGLRQNQGAGLGGVP